MDQLIIGLPGRRKVLLSFIDFCREPKLVSECDGKIDELQAHNHSVYTPVVLRQMLELAGAIEYVQGKVIEGEEGNDYGEYLTVAKREEGAWVATSDGVAYADACIPSKELEALLDKEPEYSDIYKQILQYCAEEPRDKKSLDLMIDAEEKCQKPRRFSGYFVDRLEKCEAMEWDGLWKTTNIGQSVL
ncbi:MAG: hypothetical protein HGA54_07205 [Actinobacteria bacterium]|nr:hypothetical protein [Actinomycetota bacterium]